MMKKTQIKDALRNIWKQKVSFFSIIVIAMMGVTAFLGIDYTATALRKNGSAIYNRLNFRDIEILSTLLFSEEDLESIRNVEGVVDAEPLRYTTAKLDHGKDRRNVSVLSGTERINLSHIIDGRLPDKITECAVEQRIADDMGLQVGDRIRLTDGADEAAQYLRAKEFIITGITRHPDHTNNTVPDLFYAFVMWDAFDGDALNGGFMKAEVVVDKPADINRFSKRYNTIVAKVMERIDALSVDSTARRDEDVRDLADKKIAEGQKKLDATKQKLQSARKELDEKTKELSEGEQKIADAEKQLPGAKKLLNNGWRQLESGRAQLEDGRRRLESEREKIDAGKAELDAAKAKLDDGKQQLESGFSVLEDAKATIRNAIRKAYERLPGSQKYPLNWASRQTANADDPDQSVRYLQITDTVRFDLNVSFEKVLHTLIYSDNVPERFLAALYEMTQRKTAPLKSDGTFDTDAIRKTLAQTAASAVNGYTKLSNGCAEWDNKHGEYLKGLSAYRDGEKQFENGLRQFQAAETLLNEKEAQYQKGMREYRAQRAKYDQAVETIAAGKQEIEEGRRLLADGETQYAESVEKYEDGVRQLDDARKQAENADPCRC